MWSVALISAFVAMKLMRLATPSHHFYVNIGICRSTSQQPKRPKPMQITLAPLLASILTLFIPAASHAAPAPVKPGLWEYQVQIKSQSGQVEAGLAIARDKLAALPAQERKKVEKVMAEKGVSLSASGTVMKICLSAQDAANGAIPIQKGNCIQSTVSSAGNLTQVSFNCRSEPSVIGTGEITILSPTRFEAQAEAQTQVGGKPETLNLRQEGKWLGTDCAGIPAAYAP
jgi:hypothetical protein